MKRDIRMKDERDLEGTGFVTIEVSMGNEMYEAWTTLNRTWFYKGVAKDVDVHCDTVDEITVAQFTEKRNMWSKKTKHDTKHSTLRSHYNYTVFNRVQKDRKC